MLHYAQVTVAILCFRFMRGRSRKTSWARVRLFLDHSGRRSEKSSIERHSLYRETGRDTETPQRFATCTQVVFRSFSEDGKMPTESVGVQQWYTSVRLNRMYGRSEENGIDFETTVYYILLFPRAHTFSGRIFAPKVSYCVVISRARSEIGRSRPPWRDYGQGVLSRSLAPLAVKSPSSHAVQKSKLIYATFFLYKLFILLFNLRTKYFFSYIFLFITSRLLIIYLCILHLIGNDWWTLQTAPLDEMCLVVSLSDCGYLKRVIYPKQTLED